MTTAFSTQITPQELLAAARSRQISASITDAHTIPPLRASELGDYDMTAMADALTNRMEESK